MYFFTLLHHNKKNIMTWTKSFPTILFIIFISYSCNTSRQIQSVKQYGTYHDNIAWGGFFVKQFVINKDHTFTYRFRGDLLSDTSSGSYYLIKDTIFFKYHYNNYDSIKQAYKAAATLVPFELTLNDNSSHIRPKKFLWKGDRMYYFHVQTGELVKLGIERGKEVEVYLGLIR